MNTFWLKLAAVAVVIVGIIIAISIFKPSESQPQAESEVEQAKPKTVYDMWQQDEKRLRAEPNAPPLLVEANQQPAKQQTPAERPPPKFTELLPEQQAEAERLFEWAVTQRKMARLPGMTATSFNQMVDACRQIIEKFPGSEFDYKARRMLAEVPSRFRDDFGITDEELDLSRFFK